MVYQKSQVVISNFNSQRIEINILFHPWKKVSNYFFVALSCYHTCFISPFCRSYKCYCKPATESKSPTSSIASATSVQTDSSSTRCGMPSRGWMPSEACAASRTYHWPVWIPFSLPSSSDTSYAIWLKKKSTSR